jgi:DNA-binding beta-propeller fold protein YncE
VRVIALLSCLSVLTLGALATAEDGLKVDTILADLDNPAGIAIQPETGIVFVSDSGASRIVKVVDGKAEPVITDFPVDIYGKGPKYNIGPLGLLFLDQNTLVVGGGDSVDGEDSLRVFDLKDLKEPIKAEKAKKVFKLAADGDIKGEGNFYALAATPDAIYVTCNGDDTKGWVSKAAYSGSEVAGFERYLATKEATEVDAPVGITVSPAGQLVVGQMGEITVPNDSLLTFYDPVSKEKLLNLKTELHDITGLAYSPRGQLYALDFAWADTKQGGLFQLLADTEKGMRTKKIMELDKPTAMAFDAEGALYITVIGEEKKGKLLKVAPGL